SIEAGFPIQDDKGGEAYDIDGLLTSGYDDVAAVVAAVTSNGLHGSNADPPVITENLIDAEGYDMSMLPVDDHFF
ncbi:MAG: hypothetical protein AAGF28_13460, partial [Pseudomonadota bacterium]